jgi:L-2-hydroxycarboxylate dehydrogenase (NAD+)
MKQPSVSDPTSVDLLLRACVWVLTAMDVTKEDAQLAADALVRSECEGAVSHGLARLPAIIRRIKAGVIVPRAELAVIRESATAAVLDAQHQIPQVAAARAMNFTIRKASEAGMAAVTVRNGGNFGRAGHSAVLAAENEMIGIAASNASPRIVPRSGMQPVLGNNPWSVAFPTQTEPMVIDMANSIVAAGKIRAAKADGLPIPDGWATDAAGNATTDPSAALTGALFAFGAHKGWALSLIVDVLSGVLSGGAFGDDVAPPDDRSRPQRSSFFFMAIDIRQFIDFSEFRTRVDDLLGRLRSSGSGAVRLPGESSVQARSKHLSEGVPVRESTVKALDKALTELDLPTWGRVLEEC